jgi:hypothetical protein
MNQSTAVVPPLADAEDPLSWHALDPVPDPCVAMRRARRIDVVADGDLLLVDAMFRDSSWLPDRTEIAVHEYRLTASVDRATAILSSVEAEPRVLPFAECPAAAGNVGRLVGVPMQELRHEVLERLQTTDCCTHLNDALRALAEVPALAAALHG